MYSSEYILLIMTCLMITIYQLRIHIYAVLSPPHNPHHDPSCAFSTRHFQIEERRGREQRRQDSSTEMLDLIPYLIIGCGILQLPIWLDMLLPFLPATRLRTIIARSMKIILMSSMVFCVTYSAYLNVVVFIPATYPSSPLLSLFHHLLTLYLYLQLMSYYIAACTLEPSRPLPLAHEQQSGDEERQEQESTTTPARICSICNCYQYARVSHCHICNRCSELMDHHW